MLPSQVTFSGSRYPREVTPIVIRRVLGETAARAAVLPVGSLPSPPLRGGRHGRVPSADRRESSAPHAVDAVGGRGGTRANAAVHPAHATTGRRQRRIPDGNRVR